MKAKWIKAGPNTYTLQTSLDLSALMEAIKEAERKALGKERSKKEAIG